jgi:hypothetical protein
MDDKENGEFSELLALNEHLLDEAGRTPESIMNFLRRYLWVHRPVFLHRLLRGRARPSLPPSMLMSILRRIYGRPAPRQLMAPELRRRLQGEFKPEVERLSKLLARDLTHWSTE